MAKDTSLDLAARVGCLRKYIEHTNLNPRVDSTAYNVLSSLIHGRPIPTSDNEGQNKLDQSQIDVGCNEIKEYITDFDYSLALTNCDSTHLKNRYTSEKIPYIKILILRAYVEQNQEARNRLRTANDVLRKYVDETFHIENDYLYSLDVRRFNIVPEHYMRAADDFMKNEIQLAF